MADTTASIPTAEAPDRAPYGGVSGAFRLTAFDTPDGTVVALTGELDVATAPILDDYFRTVETSCSARFVVDAAKLAFCGCAGLDVLVRAQRRIVGEGGWLRVCGTTPNFRTILRITDLSGTLRCYPTTADAFANRAPHQIAAVEVWPGPPSMTTAA